MTRQSPPELFAQRPVRSDFGRHQGPSLNVRRVVFLISLVVVAVLIGIGVSSLWGSDDEGQPQEIPTVKAELPLKQRPEQPGGIDIPHQDVQVFQQLDNKTSASPVAKGGVEHLLPPPATPQPVPVAEEQPKAIESAAPAQVTETQPSVRDQALATDNLPPPVTEAVVTEVKKPEAVQPEPKQTVQAAKKEEPPKKEVALAKKETQPAVTKAVEKKPTKTESAVKDNPEAAKAEAAMARLPKELFTSGEVPSSAPAAAVPVQPAPPVQPQASQAVQENTVDPQGGKMSRVQLASYPDEATAKSELKRLSAKLSGSLGGASLQVVRADLPKGTYYRVISSQMPDYKAKGVCASLNAQSTSCLVVR